MTGREGRELSQTMFLKEKNAFSSNCVGNLLRIEE